MIMNRTQSEFQTQSTILFTLHLNVFEVLLIILS
jgi:hypothetical protein